MTPGQVEDFDLKGKVWEQVWAHSRHLETMRSQYLGFFFTAALAVTAIAAKDLADDGLKTSGSLIAFSALMLGLEVLTAFLLLAVKRIGDVLSQYRNSEQLIRGDSSEKWAQLPGPSEDPALSTQGAAEGVLYAALGLFLAALVAGAIRSAEVGGGTAAVCWVAFGLGLVAAVACLGRVGLGGRGT